MSENPNLTDAVYNILADAPVWLIVSVDDGLIAGQGDTKKLAIENAIKWVAEPYLIYCYEWPDEDSTPMDIGDWIRTECEFRKGTRRLGREFTKHGGYVQYKTNDDNLLDVSDD